MNDMNRSSTSGPATLIGHGRSAALSELIAIAPGGALSTMLVVPFLDLLVLRLRPWVGRLNPNGRVMETPDTKAFIRFNVLERALT